MNADAPGLDKNLRIIHRFDTQLCADSVEWCPVAPYQRVFVLGTYEVIKEQNAESTDETPSDSPSTKRHGRLFLFEVRDSEKLDPVFSLELPAILDMKWSHVSVVGRVLLAIATALGQILIYALNDSLQLEKVTEAELTRDTSKEILALSLDWSTGRGFEGSGDVHICVSDSQGCVTLFKLANSTLEMLKHMKGHDYEAWIVAFDYWNPGTFFSGGDDCKLCIWDNRSEIVPQKRITSFDAGVTSLHSNTFHENILACGSYDEKVRIWDTRRMKQPLAILDLGGGIWRVKWDPQEGRYIVAASMYNGVHFLDCEKTLQSGDEIIQIAYSAEHKSIAYGADWCYLSGYDLGTLCDNQDCWEDNSKTSLVATCSFYDKQLHVSLINKLSF